MYSQQCAAQYSCKSMGSTNKTLEKFCLLYSETSTNEEEREDSDMGRTFCVLGMKGFYSCYLFKSFDTNIKTVGIHTRWKQHHIEI